MIDGLGGVMRRLLLVVLSVSFLSSCLEQLYSGNQSTRSASVPDKTICHTALTSPNNPLGWDTRTRYASQVREAKSRGLTLERCAQLTGRNTPVADSTLSDKFLCSRALDSPYEKVSWTFQYPYDRFIKEAKRRGLTFERCAELTGRDVKVAIIPTPTVPISPPPPSPVQSSPRTAPRHLVMAVQKRLTELGYDPGPVDGVGGQKTRAAIKAFQRLTRLPTTGEVSEGLLKKFNAQVKVAEAEPTQSPPPVQQPSQALVPSGVDFGRYHALIIGNNAYRSLPRLKTAINDATGVANLLREEYGFNVTILTDATRDDTIKTLYGIRSRLKERDNLLIYYAGHGWLDEKADRGYWFPVDATEDNPSRWLSNATITDTLKAVSARHVLVVADSCYSGAMARAFKRGALVKPRTPGFIAQMLDKKSRTVLASGGMEPVVDSGGGGHSVFAKALLDSLADNRGVMDGTQVFAKVREQVRLNAHQTPQYSNIRFAGHEVGGDFLFVRKRSKSQTVQQTAAHAPAAPTPAPTPVQPTVGVHPNRYKPGDVFRDCEVCPEMVVIPDGLFRMGSPPTEPARKNNEGPQHHVSVPLFAIGKYEVTFDEWYHCMSEGDCRHHPKDRNWGRGTRPVINVNWLDAKGFVGWISRKTGVRYRLPTESEWEYAARAKTTTAFHFGDQISVDQANFDGTVPYNGTNTGAFRRRTTPVGSFAPNSFGIFDVHGNVAEWTEDCWNPSYQHAPSDGSAWLTGNCKYRVLRGGTWGFWAESIRSSFRNKTAPDFRANGIGFRVARSVE